MMKNLNAVVCGFLLVMCAMLATTPTEAARLIRNVPEDQELKLEMNNSLDDGAGAKVESGQVLTVVQPEIVKSVRVLDDIHDMSIAPRTSSVMDIMVSVVRNLLGVVRREPPKFARQLMGAAVGRNECWQRVLCQAGRLLSGLRERASLFGIAERWSPEPISNSIKVLRRSAVDNEDCSIYTCDA